MQDLEILDTFPQFLAFWQKASAQPLEVQLELWRTEYMSQWPELLAKQLDDYAAAGVDWRAAAREHVLPFLAERLGTMRAAHAGLLATVPAVLARAREVLGFDFGVRAVIYAGIGCGAGWATTYAGSPAVLFGLENIAECGWSDTGTLAGLAAHEFSHLVHYEWRRQSGLPPPGDQPLARLYDEGFAQCGEERVAGQHAWHQAGGEWLDWCRAHRASLARAFLADLERGAPVTRFFGSWFEIEGHAQCGYFLGYEMIRDWERSLPLAQIAQLPLDEVERRARRSLQTMAADQGPGLRDPGSGACG